MPLLLTGCVQHATSNDLSQQQQEAIPRTKVVDYRLAACDTLWQLNEEEALDNWLRAISHGANSSASAGEKPAGRQRVRHF